MNDGVFREKGQCPRKVVRELRSERDAKGTHRYVYLLECSHEARRRRPRQEWCYCTICQAKSETR